MIQNKKLLIGLTLFAMMLIVSAIVYDLSSAEAQSDPLPLPTDAQDPEAQEIATVNADLATRSIYNYRISYLIAKNTVISNSLIKPESLNQSNGAIAFDNWDDFIADDATQPFQVVIIHESAADLVDRVWLNEAYSRGVIIAGINLTKEQMQLFTGDYCIGKGAASPSGERWAIYYYSVVLTTETDRQIINKGNLTDCKENLANVDRYGVTQGASWNPVKEQSDIDYLSHSLFINLYSTNAKIPGTER